MLLLAYRNLRTRPLRVFFTAMSIALGVAMIFATRIVAVTSAQIGAEVRAGRLAGADLEIASATSALLSDELVATLGARPEVAAVAAIYRGLEGEPDASIVDQANPLMAPPLKGTGLALAGIDPATVLTPYELAAGQFLSAADADEVLLPSLWAIQQGIGVGAEVRLVTGQQRRSYRVVGLLKSDGQDALTRQPSAWLPLRTMQAAFDTPGATTVVLLRLRQDQRPDAVRDQLQQELGTSYVVTSASGGASTRPFIILLTDMALPFASLAVLLTGSFLVYNAFAITLTERRREIGQLRTLGMTRRQVRRQVLAEALLVALLGSAIGLLLGLLLGRGMVLVVVGVLQGRAVPAVALPLDGALLALAAGVLITLAVSLTLARQAGRLSPLLSLRAETAHEAARGWYMRYGWVGALLSLALFGAAALWVLTLDESANMGLPPLMAIPFILVITTICSLPLVLRLALWAFRRLSPRLGPTAQMASGNLDRQQGRAALTTVTLMIGLMLVVSLSGVMRVLIGFQESTILPLFRADFMLVRPLPNTTFEQAMTQPSMPPLAPELESELRAISQDATVFSYANLMLPGYSMGGGIDNGMAVNVDLLRQSPAFKIREGSWAEAERWLQAGPAILLPELVARRHNVHPGDTVQIETVKGRVPFTVALVGGPMPAVSSEVGVEYFNSHPFIIFINAREGGDQAALETRLRDLAQRQRLFMTADPQESLLMVLAQLMTVIVGLFGGLTSLSSVVAGFGIVNTLLALVLERQREIGVLRALGMTRAQLRRMVVLEAGVLGITGALVGVLGGLAITAGFSLLVTEAKTLLGAGDFAPPLPWAVAAIAAVVGPSIAMLAALWPAARASSVTPTEAMRAEGAAGFLKPAPRHGPRGMRARLRRMPLAARLSLILGLLLVVTIGSLTAMNVRYARQILEENVQALSVRLMGAIAEVSKERMPLDANELTPETIQALQDQSQLQVEALQAQFQGGSSPYEFGLRYLIVADTNLKVVTSDRPELIGRVLSDTVSLPGSDPVSRVAGWSGERNFEVTVPIENRDDDRLGYLILGTSTEPVDQLIADVRRSALLAMLAALLASAGLTIWLTRRTLAPLHEVITASQDVARGDLTRQVSEERSDEIGRLAQAFNAMVRGLNERERLRDLFGRFLSREVSEALLDGRIVLEGERREVTVLFVDMRGSTAFAEQHQPEDVLAALNQYFSVIVQATESQGGIVNRFLGDGALCIFGAPRSYEDHAARGVRAALEMRLALALLNQRRAQLSLPQLEFGIGLSTGAVTAGATGSQERQEYTVIGDAVNLGARIEGLSRSYPDYAILISQHTWAALGPLAAQYTMRDLGELEIRGRRQPVRVFGLLSLDEAPGVRPPASGYPAPGEALGERRQAPD